MIHGGCLCGACRYLLTTRPKVSANCHCSMCRRQTGAAFLTYVAVNRNSFVMQRGRLADYRSSSDAIRSHCGSCGSPMTFVFDADPESVWVTLGTLDEPSLVPPTENWFVKDKVEWVCLDNTLKAWPAAPEA